MKQLLLYLLLITMCYSCKKKEVSKYEDGSDPTGTVWITKEK